MLSSLVPPQDCAHMIFWFASHACLFCVFVFLREVADQNPHKTEIYGKGIDNFGLVLDHCVLLVGLVPK